MDGNRRTTNPGRRVSNRYTRRQVLACGSAGLAAGALLNTSLISTAHAQTPTPRIMADDFTGMVDIGGRMLYVETAGSGSPTVVLEAGLGGRSDVWSRDLQEPVGERQMVFPAVAEFTHVVAYDRPGTIGEVNPDLEPLGPLFYPSRSDPVPMPRTIPEIVDDFVMMLKNSGQTGPYVLVGHSLGGLMMRYFASTHPDDVVGLVLVDGTNEYVWDSFQQVIPPANWAAFEQMSVENPELKAAYPDAEFILTAPLAEDPSVLAVRQAQADSPLQPMPMVVLSHGIPFPAPFDWWPSEETEQIMAEGQARVAQLVPGAKHIVAEKSGHNIHQDQPDLVIEAIRMVVDAVRDPSTWLA